VRFLAQIVFLHDFGPEELSLASQPGAHHLRKLGARAAGERHICEKESTIVDIGRQLSSNRHLDGVPAWATLPADRRDWGAAMAAELAQVRSRSSRWWFAAGCARGALFPPRNSRAPVLVVGVGTAVAVVTAGHGSSCLAVTQVWVVSSAHGEMVRTGHTRYVAEALQ